MQCPSARLARAGEGGRESLPKDDFPKTPAAFRDRERKSHKKTPVVFRHVVAVCAPCPPAPFRRVKQEQMVFSEQGRSNSSQRANERGSKCGTYNMGGRNGTAADGGSTRERGGSLRRWRRPSPRALSLSFSLGKSSPF